MRVKLSDLYDIGSSKRVFQSEWRKSGVPFYRAREIAKLSIDGYVDNELFIDEDLYLEYIDKYGKPEAGDVMVTGVGTLGVCYVVKQEDRFYFKDGNILWFKQKAKDRILPEYLVKAFDSKDVKEFIDKNSSGTTVGTFTIQTAKKMEISLPSIEEQRNIIQKITKIESVIKQRRQELQLLDDLIKARFVEMFGDPVHSEKYGTRKLSSCVADKSDMVDGPFGSQVNTKVDYIENGEIPVIRTVNVKMMSFSPIDLKYMKREKYETVIRSQVLPGDVILTKVGTIGNVCIFPNTFDEAVLSTTGSCRIRVDNSVVNTQFFAYNLMYLKGKLLEIASAGVQPFLNMNHVKNIDILDVPLEKQKEFAAFVHQVDKSKVAVQKALDETQLLFDSLMQEYFG